MTTISEGPRSVEDAVSGLGIRAQAFIDGGYVDAASGETFDCVSPIGGEVVATVAACDSADVDRAVAGARAAFESGVWSRLAPKKRKKALQRLAALMSDHAEELALLETLDMGKPIRDARNVDVPLAAECVAWYGEAIDKVYDEIAPTGHDAARLDRARAARRRRRRRAVELPAPDGLVEARRRRSRPATASS